MTKPGNEYLVGAKITVDTNKMVRANSLEEAIEIGRKLKVTDFIKILGDHNDSEVEIDSVFKS